MGYSEKYGNNAVATLVGAIDDVQTTLDMDMAGLVVWSNVPQYRIKIGDEIMLVTAIDDSADPIWTLTVQRQAENSNPGSHSDGDEIRLVLTKQSLQLASQSWNTTDIQAEDYDNTFLGTGYAINEGIGLIYYANHRSVADTFAIEFIQKTGLGGMLAGCKFFCPASDGVQAALGIGWRDSVGGKIVMLHWLKNGTTEPFKLCVAHYTSETDSAPTIVAEIGQMLMPPNDFWLQTFKDSGDLFFYIRGGGFVPFDDSGNLAMVVWKEGFTDFFDNEPDQIIIGGYHYGDFADIAEQSQYGAMLLHQIQEQD